MQGIEHIVHREGTVEGAFLLAGTPRDEEENNKVLVQVPVFVLDNAHVETHSARLALPHKSSHFVARRCRCRLQVPSFVYSTSHIPEERWGSEYDGLMHVTDWLPTIATAAGVELTGR